MKAAQIATTCVLGMLTWWLMCSVIGCGGSGAPAPVMPAADGTTLLNPRPTPPKSEVHAETPAGMDSFTKMTHGTGAPARTLAEAELREAEAKVKTAEAQKTWAEVALEWIKRVPPPPPPICAPAMPTAPAAPAPKAKGPSRRP